MNNFSHVPPGFRFHPTDEELVDYYLRKKIASKRIDLDVIKDVDLYKIEPWDLIELCRIGTEEQSDWYFFSHKDKKYPTGTRTNRATRAGFWKATGRDKAIYSKNNLIGMRKTLVFYQGRAPNGHKSDWIMHEYRLETNENGTPQQEEGWVVCRVFKKRLPTIRREGEHETMSWYDDQVSFMPDFDSPRHISQPYNNNTSYNHPHYSCKQELDSRYQTPRDPYLQLPQLESPKFPQSISNVIRCPPMVSYNQLDMNNNGSLLQSSTLVGHEEHHLQQSNVYGNNNGEQGADDQVTDWRVLDKFVANQLSHENASKDTSYSDDGPSLQEVEDLNLIMNDTRRQEMASEIDMWK